MGSFTAFASPAFSLRASSSSAFGYGVSMDTARDWTGAVVAHELRVEYVAMDIDTVDTDRMLYHLELELDTPLPVGALDHTQFLCLTWPYGGLWKICSVSEGNTKVQCLSWRRTGLQSASEVQAHTKDVALLAKKVASPRGIGSSRGDMAIMEDSLLDMTELDDQGSSPASTLATLFTWKMMCGEWSGDAHHWFIRDIDPPPVPMTLPMKLSLLVKLFVGFAPLEARIEVNAVTAIDTVAQTYAADVTWQVTVPAITALRADTVLLEFLELVEIDASQFEFTNVREVQSERSLTSSVTPAGEIGFQDRTLRAAYYADSFHHVEAVNHLQFSRRLIATFTEEMALHSFPFDQQKLVFEFSTGSSGMPANSSLQLIPAPVEPGSFSIDDFQLGNMFDVAYHSKIFVGALKESGPRKAIAFEMVLERRSAYFLTNVALIASIITYLCFIVTYAPLRDGSLMETDARLQNVTALVLTAVTFKNQVASLIPQISYFTILDSYVFFCFLVTSFVTIENALFPLMEKHLPFGQWNEAKLLGYTLIVFTVVNVIWALYLRRWLARRRVAAHVLVQVHEYIRVITDVVPAKHRENVLVRFLDAKEFEPWCVPKYLVTSTGDLHVQAPNVLTVADATLRAKGYNAFEMQKREAAHERSAFEKILYELEPGYTSSGHTPVRLAPAIPAAKTTAAEYQAGARHAPRIGTALTPSHQPPVGGGGGGEGRHRSMSAVGASHSQQDGDDVVAINASALQRLRAAARAATTMHGGRVF